MARILLTLCFCLAAGLGCRSETRPGEVEVHLDAVAIDPQSNSPVIVLEERHGSRKLPIWIGISEARSIAAELGDQEPIRPNSHDLAKRLIDGLAGAVERVTVTELSDGIYYALIQLRVGGRIVSVDARPSDAIAIGLRYGAPLFVREALFDRAQGGGFGDPGQEVEWPPSRRAPGERGTGKSNRRASDSPGQSARFTVHV
jgi:hypothetical protein